MSYELHHVSPSYLEPLLRARLPEGVVQLVTDDVKSCIRVRATPAAQAAVKELLPLLDVTPRPNRQFQLRVLGKKDAKIVLDTVVSTFVTTWEQVTWEAGVYWNPAEVAEQEARPWNCRYPIKPEQTLVFTNPSPSADGKTVRLKVQLKKTKPTAQTISLGEVTVSLGAPTPLTLGSAMPSSLQELSVIGVSFDPVIR